MGKEKVNPCGMSFGWRVLHNAILWLDHGILTPISARLMDACNYIQERHCMCENCYRRALEGDARERRKFGMEEQQ